MAIPPDIIHTVIAEGAPAVIGGVCSKAKVAGGNITNRHMITMGNCAAVSIWN